MILCHTVELRLHSTVKFTVSKWTEFLAYNIQYFSLQQSCCHFCFDFYLVIIIILLFIQWNSKIVETKSMCNYGKCVLFGVKWYVGAVYVKGESPYLDPSRSGGSPFFCWISKGEAEKSWEPRMQSWRCTHWQLLAASTTCSKMLPFFFTFKQEGNWPDFQQNCHPCHHPESSVPLPVSLVFWLSSPAFT